MIDYIVIQGRKVDTDYAKKLANQFNVEIINEIPKDKYTKYLLMDKTGISFISNKLELKGDFSKLLKRVTNGHLQHEILLKVAKQNADKNIGQLKAIDCTAGLGEDAFILAAGGYSIELYEHNPITFILLKDALKRAKNNPELKEIVSRMTLKEGDSKDLLNKINYEPDLIYLDPMFPEKKKSAESKKKLQVLHQIETPCSDENELLKAAINTHPKKIIIKRPPEGPYLGNIEPSYSVERKAVRFDCLVY